jgi:hypothetical protein
MPLRILAMFFLSPFARLPFPAAMAKAYTGDAGGKKLWP